MMIRCDAQSEFSMRFASLVVALTALAFFVPSAHAGLIGNGTNTVDALFYLGDRTPANTEDEGTQTITASGVSIPAHALDLSAITITDTTITITSETNLPYCSTGDVPCLDSFTGFEFVFSSGVDIAGVSVDPASASDMLPIAGGLTFTATDILVNLTGDSPGIGDQLILDLTFPAAAVSEPSELALFGGSLIALALARRRSDRVSQRV
jgi:hypothetical protein